MHISSEIKTVSSVQHFHSFGKSKIHLYDGIGCKTTNCVTLAILHKTEILLYLHLKLTLYNIKMNDKFTLITQNYYFLLRMTLYSKFLKIMTSSETD